MYVKIGNDHALEGYRDAQSDDPNLLRFREAPGERITSFTFPPDTDLQQALNAVIASMGHQMVHDARPAWVESDISALEDLIVQHYGVNKNKRPATWGQEVAKAVVEEEEAAPVRTGPIGIVGTQLLIFQALLVAAASMLALRTRAGRDWQARVMGDPTSDGSGAYAPGCYIGVTANGDAPDIDNTTLNGEITTGTLARAQAIYSHTNGTSAYTLTKAFVADQSVTLRKMGIFSDPAAGTMIFESLLNAISVMTPGDTTNVTETVTL
jgi:hypothetical protein